MAEIEVRDRARSLFLDDANHFGCAETVLVVLKEDLGLPDPSNPSAVMALNGGVAHSGGICGAITGSAVEAGLLAERVAPDHQSAKRLARSITAGLIDDFRCEFGAVDCRDLVGRDIGTQEQHEAFIASGIWRTVCMRQIEFCAGRIASLVLPPARDGTDLPIKQPAR
jgi:C_GCAxxG_C_C family probable redox protein